jgi:hypothetical protein
LLKEKTIYIVECEGYYKVGISIDFNVRLKGLQCSNPLPVKTIKLYNDIEHAELKESAIHKRLKEYHHIGEWFKCDLIIIENVINEILLNFEHPKQEIFDQYVDYKKERYKKNQEIMTNKGIFFYSGKKRKPKKGEWFIYNYKNNLITQADRENYNIKQYIFIPKEDINIVKFLKKED